MTAIEEAKAEEADLGFSEPTAVAAELEAALLMHYGVLFNDIPKRVRVDCFPVHKPGTVTAWHRHYGVLHS